MALVSGLFSTLTMGCSGGDEEDDGFSTFASLDDDDGTDADTDADGETDTTGDGDTGDGDGDGDTGDGDGDGDTGDGDGDPDPDPTCDDDIQNQDETDVDCGGSICDMCDEGQMCGEASDCTSNMCIGNLCVTGCLGDIECDYLDNDCQQGICNIGTCEPYPANEGQDCATGEICMAEGECTAGACVEQPLNCTDLDSDCSMGVCDLDTGECAAEVVNEGMDCNDAEGCALMPTCTAGVCEDPDNGALFYEPFADNAAGWILETNWAIGPAVDGCGDPGTDHTPTDDNGIAGVVIGGCAPDVVHPYYCLTSPPMDSAGLGTLWMTYYRDLWSDYTPYMKNTLEVFNGSTWTILFETFGSPGVDDDAWSYFAYDVSAYTAANMQFRWCYNIQSGGVFDRGSWNVDDVTVSVSECNGAD